MIQKTGDMFEEIDKATFFLVTGNSYITKDGRAVMGRGAALQLKNKIPLIDKVFGIAIKWKSKDGIYGVVWHMPYGLFQVKKHFRDKAELSIIKFSTKKLKQYAELIPDAIYFLNFPGIGYGQLISQKEEILKIIKILPDNVWVWERWK